MKQISVLIITNNRAAKLRRLLESVLRFASPKVAEILVFINGEDKATELLLNELTTLHSNIRTFRSSGVNRGEARNFLIKMSFGKILYFLDDDVLIVKDVFTLISEKFREYDNVSILGGPNLTMPDSSLFQVSQGHAFGSFFGTSLVSRRYKNTGCDKYTDESGLMLCNLVVKKEVFEKTGIWFPINFISAEENLLLAKFARMGYNARYISELEVFHERRATYRDFFSQVFSYGKGRAQISKTFPSYLKPVYFLPVLFLFYLVTAVFIKSSLYLFPLLIYLFLDLLFSLKIAYRENDFRLFSLILFVFPTIHLAYAFGFLSGMVKITRSD